MTDCTIVSEHLHDEKPEELISLMEKLHGREDINRMIEAVEDERLSIEDVFSVALENKTKSGFHAAWVLEKLCEKNPIYALYFVDDKFKASLDYFVFGCVLEFCCQFSVNPSFVCL